MNLGNTASAVMDKLCGCCCANWCERLRHTDSATAIVPRVKTPSQQDTRWKRLSSGRRATSSPPSPLGSAELLRVQPGLDPYYSDDDASTSSEGSAKVPDGTSPIKRAASMRRPRPDEQFANPNDESRKRSSSMSGASPSTLTVPSPVDSRRRRSFENFRMCDLGEIRPELYVMEDAQSSLDKTQSPSKDDANEEAYGILSFSVRYEESTQRLYLHLQSIEDLPSKGHRENVSYDPVVLSCLLPDCKHVQKSKSAKASLNPVFDDTVVFPLDRTKSAENVAVRISVYESDDLCTNGACTTSAIGHVLLPVVDCLTPTDNPREFRRRVGRRSLITGNLGRLLISLAYLPSLERLSCVILRAKDVRCEKGTNVSSLETYVKVTLMCGVDKVKSRKTAIIRGTDSPVYTESLCFVVPMSYIDETSLVIQLTQHAQLKKDRILGQVILGPYIYTQGSAISHWGKMLARREAAKQWHNLYL